MFGCLECPGMAGATSSDALGPDRGVLPTMTKSTCTPYIEGELREVRVARMRFYADGQLEITGELKVFQQYEN